MTHWENIWTFRTANFAVTFAIAPDEDLDLSWDEDGSTAEGLNSGEYVAFVARIEVIHLETGAVLGSDHLGSCIYESPQAFIDHRNGGSSYFSDMVRSAIGEARRNVASFPKLRRVA